MTERISPEACNTFDRLRASFCAVFHPAPFDQVPRALHYIAIMTTDERRTKDPQFPKLILYTGLENWTGRNPIEKNHLTLRIGLLGNKVAFELGDQTIERGVSSLKLMQFVEKILIAMATNQDSSYPGTSERLMTILKEAKQEFNIGTIWEKAKNGWKNPKYVPKIRMG